MVTINISKNDFEHIERWNKHNVEKRMNTTGKFPYNEFTLKVEGDKKDDFIYYTAFLRDYEISQAVVTYEYTTTKDLFFVDGFREFNEKLLADMNDKTFGKNTTAICSTRLFYICIMAYIQHKMNKRKIKVVEVEPRNKAVAKKTTNKRKPKAEYLLEDFIVYEHKEPPKTKPHIYTCESWGVKGHYRHLKNGKTIWVREFTKGKGTPKHKEIFLTK